MVAPRSLVGFGDTDSFYASAEATRRPWLTAMPVGVLGNQGACVIARNYPMKKYGIKVGEPVWEAKQKCPDGVYIKRDFRWYETLSRRMLAELRDRISPRVEFHSIDEFFWKGFPLPHLDFSQSAVAVRDHIKAAVGVPMTVAFARTRTLAKLCTDTDDFTHIYATLDYDHCWFRISLTIRGRSLALPCWPPSDNGNKNHTRCRNECCDNPIRHLLLHVIR